MSLFKRGDIWWLYVVHNGRRIRKSTETDDRRSAQRIHDEFRARLWKHKPGGGTFYSALETWAKTAGSPDRYRVARLKRLYRDRPLNAVTAKTLQDVIPSNPGTFIRYVNLVQAVLHKADIHIKIHRPKMPPNRIRFLNAEEWERLDEALPANIRPMARLAIATGLRKANVTQLEWSQIDLGRRVAWIHADQAKSRRAIGISLSDAAMEVLRSQSGIDERRVFVGPKHFHQVWKNALKAAQIENFRWHDLRHTWASWHVMSGTPLQVLKELGGWATLNQVLKYAHLAPDHLAVYANNAIPRHELGHTNNDSALKSKDVPRESKAR